MSVAGVCGWLWEKASLFRSSAKGGEEAGVRCVTEPDCRINGGQTQPCMMCFQQSLLQDKEENY